MARVTTTLLVASDTLAGLLSTATEGPLFIHEETTPTAFGLTPFEVGVASSLLTQTRPTSYVTTTDEFTTGSTTIPVPSALSTRDSQQPTASSTSDFGRTGSGITGLNQVSIACSVIGTALVGSFAIWVIIRLKKKRRKQLAALETGDHFIYQENDSNILMKKGVHVVTVTEKGTV